MFPDSVNIATVHQDGTGRDPSSLHFFTTTSDLCVSYLHPTTGYSMLFSPCLYPGLNLLILPTLQQPPPNLVSFLLPKPRYNPLSKEQLDFNVILAYSATLKHRSSFLWLIGRQNTTPCCGLWVIDFSDLIWYSTAPTGPDLCSPTPQLIPASEPLPCLPSLPHNLPPEHKFASCTPFRS